ncbi:hypothetical protein KAR91_39495 [Candidatus Pacearchaeota archaeon]|nr:hypothetical protein [Candidatus Pacearchaeota archaeon]
MRTNYDSKIGVSELDASFEDGGNFVGIKSQPAYEINKINEIDGFFAENPHINLDVNKKIIVGMAALFDSLDVHELMPVGINCISGEYQKCFMFKEDGIWNIALDRSTEAVSLYYTTLITNYTDKWNGELGLAKSIVDGVTKIVKLF